MHCRTVRTPDGITFIACGSRERRPRCQEPGCMGESEALCDFKLRGPKEGKTCDKRLCSAHRQRVAVDKDLCPVHFKDPRVQRFLASAQVER